MTADELARSDFLRAQKRWLALQTLMQADAYPDVVREAQELVELVLKGMLRWVEVDPPKWRDVGGILLDHASKFPPSVRDDLPGLARISRQLRRDREVAFSGEIDLIPEQLFDRTSAQQALDDAGHVPGMLRFFTEPVDK